VDWTSSGTVGSVWGGAALESDSEAARATSETRPIGQDWAAGGVSTHINDGSEG